MRVSPVVRFWSLLFAAVLASRSFAMAQQLVINEIMAAGQSILPDEEGAFPDWIEIANPGSVPVNLTGWHLTDNTAKPAKWTFPARTIPAGGFLVVFASGRDRAPADGVLHASFSLKSGGEFLALTAPDGTIVSSASYPVQLPDVSYEPAGERFFGEPTPGAANTTQPLAMVAAPAFSEGHGFKEAPFQLTLTTTTEGASIRYTTDGSEPTETNGQLYSGPITIKRTSVIRAAAFSAGAQPSPAVTRTYLFIDDIVTQSLDGKRPQGWPAKWGMNRVDYGMDPRIVSRAPHKKTIKDDLRTIPSLSIVTDLKHLFDPATGIYANPQSKGEEWERPMSIELIHPDGTQGFQVNAGLRIRGGASRTAENTKHSFRVLFRKEYGAPELKYPLFGPEGAQSISRFDIRCEQLIAWHYFVDPQADFIRDIFGRDTQGALGQPYKRGDFHHLYINGQYWGLYQTDERVTADYAAAYFGGDDEDYDVVKFDAESNYGTGFTDGTFGSWRRLFEAGVKGFVDNDAYFKVQGLNPDGSRNRSYERLLDVDNLIDYMLAGIFICADDSPPSSGTQNNWYGLRSRKGDFGFRFFAHDWEISMIDALENRVGEAPATSPFEDGFLEPGSTNPWHYWQAMRLNEEFRLRVADRAQRFMFNGGPLTTEAARARWQRRMDEIDRAVVGESARWGDARQEGIRAWGNAAQIAAEWLKEQQAKQGQVAGAIDPLPNPGPRPGSPAATSKKPKPFTRADWFAAANDRVLNGFLVARNEAMLQHLKDGELFPSLPAPQVEPHGGALPIGGLVTLIAPPEMSAEVYYTTDGSDPRKIGGAVASDARLYTAPFALARETTIKVRAKAGTEWSALVEATFTPGVDYRPLRITEIHYNAPGSGGALATDSEFLELKNTGAVPLDLSGARFTAGIDFTFPQGATLAPGAIYLLARSEAAFATRYPGVTPDGIYLGRLNDDGETVTLATAAGARIFSVTYKDRMPWPLAADGLGFSLGRANDGDPDKPESWRPSAESGGSPGVDDPAGSVLPKVVINEVLTRPASGGSKAIELLNPGAAAADVSGWWLSNDPATPRQFRLPPGSVIPAGGYLIVTEAQFGTGANPVSLPATGGAIYLFSANAADVLTGFAHGFEFAAALEGISFGRHINSAGDEQFTAQAAVTLGTLNSGPAGASLRISELHYFPVQGGDEFVEIENRSDSVVSLAEATLGGVGYTFPAAAEIAAHGRALVVMIDPDLFRQKYEVPLEVPIFGPASGVLQNDGERVELRLPIVVEGTASQHVVDSVRYNDKRPWPTGAAGYGASLQRLASGGYGDEPLHWAADRPTPGAPNKVNAPPRIELTSPADGTVLLPPRMANFEASASDPDGSIAKVQFLVDGIVIGEDETAPFSFVWRPTGGLHDLSARAIDDQGASTESDIVTVDVDAPEFGVGLGVRGEYFANTDFSGAPTVRNDPMIRFDWAERPPLPGFPQAGYSVRWTGKILPRVTGDHSFFLRTSGGVRLFINDELVMDLPEDLLFPGQSEFPAVVSLTAGELADLRLEYTEQDGFGSVELLCGEPGRFDSATLGQTQLYLPDQDPDALGIASITEIPARLLGREFRTQLQGMNGTRPYSWSAESSELPPGVTLNARGVLSGTPTRAGIYRFDVVLSDAAGAEAEKTFTLQVKDPNPKRLTPTVKILKPAPNSRFGDGAIRLTGTASAPQGLAELRYSVNQGPWHAFDATARWEVLLDRVRGLRPGRNEVRVIAVDQDGRESAPASRSFQRKVLGPLTVRVEGEGTVTASFLGTTQREIGKDYTIVATPKPGFILQEWLGASGFGPKLRFTMAEDLELTAVFVPNPYREIAGTYSTLLQGETPDHRTRGSIHLSLTSTGAFTGKLNFAGRSYPLRGVFDPFGAAYVTVEDKNGSFLGLSMMMDFGTGAIDVRAGRSANQQYFEGAGLAIRADYDPVSAPCPFAGAYSVVLTPPAGVSIAPSSDYSATVTIKENGKVSLAGKLTDGTRWKASSNLRIDGVLPVYSGLYKRKGSLSGDLAFTADDPPSGNGLLFLSKPAKEPDGDPATVTLEAAASALPADAQD